MLLEIYHELGHIKNGDNEGGVYQRDFSGEHFIPGQTISSFSQDHPKLSAYLNQLKEYVDIAKAKLDKTSQTGKIIKEEVAKNVNVLESSTGSRTICKYFNRACPRVSS